MIGRVPMLAAILVAQLAIAGWVLLADDEAATSEQLLGLEPSAVTALQISDNEGGSLQLTRSGDGWMLDGGLPADGGKVQEAIESVATASAGWPVATSTDSQRRFEVTEESHQRRLRLRLVSTKR